MLDFITIGGATRDIFFKIEDAKKKRSRSALDNDYLILPYGEKLIAKDAFYTYGGGAANSAICLARQGAKVGTICNIGIEGTGSLLIDVLKKENVSTNLISRDKKNHTGLSIFILGNDNEHTGFLERGANDFLSFKSRKINKTKWFYISSLTGESADLLSEIFSYAKRNQIKIAFNPGSQQLSGNRKKLDFFISQSDIAILNLEEAELLVAEQKRKIKNKRNLMVAVSKLGADITLITDGECGSHAIKNGKIYSQSAIPKKVVDTTGAGDSFGATFALCISRGNDIQYGLKLASINSASVVSKMGAQQGLMSQNELKRSEWL